MFVKNSVVIYKDKINSIVMLNKRFEVIIKGGY